MRVVTSKGHKYTRYDFQVRIGTTWRTVAELQRNPFDFMKGAPQFLLYFLEYGVANAENYGNYSVGLYDNDYITMQEAIERATPIVQKKLYKIASGIMDGLKMESEGNG